MRRLIGRAILYFLRPIAVEITTKTFATKADIDNLESRISKIEAFLKDQFTKPPAHIAQKPKPTIAKKATVAKAKGGKSGRK